MDTMDAYNNWAKTYDEVTNLTRDLEAIAIKSVLGNSFHDKILEIGCGTGKNTVWLANKCNHLTGVDFSESMLKQAMEKIASKKVTFQQADINEAWHVEKVNLITCSLVLEHIENLAHIFKQAASSLEPGGSFYLCELHPFKQLLGSRAKFEKGGDVLHLEYFIHHISDYFSIAKDNGFSCNNLNEWFDAEDRNQPPRLISFLFTLV